MEQKLDLNDKEQIITAISLLSRKQMLQRLPTEPAQLKADNTSEDLLNDFCQTDDFLYLTKQISKKNI